MTYLLCNPHNPTAVVHTADELAGVAALAETYGVRVVVDEIHGPLVPEGFVPYLSVARHGQRVRRGRRRRRRGTSRASRRR